jgi:deoxyribonuclease V
VTATTRFILALDAAYGETRAAAACVAFADWEDEFAITFAHVAPISAEYESGAFYKRELPPLLQLMTLAPAPKAIIVDGYAWLSSDGRPGLGARLHEALAGAAPVIGVAKTPFRGDDWSAQITRGESTAPLFITAAGMPLAEAASNIVRMHGDHRLPTHLKSADRIARGALAGIVGEAQ